MSTDVIASDSTSTAADSDGFAFAVISTKAFLCWQSMVGGRMKSDLRFSKKQTWNTFPLPAVSAEDREKMIAAGQKVLDARALHPDRPLADQYNPLAMDPCKRP